MSVGGWTGCAMLGEVCVDSGLRGSSQLILYVEELVRAGLVLELRCSMIRGGEVE